MKKFITIGIGVGLLIVVSVLFWHHEKSSGDAMIRQKLTGPWVTDYPGVKGAVTFRSDGSYAVNQTQGFGTNERPVQFEGTWQVRDGYLIMMSTQAVSGGIYLESPTRAKVIRVNDQEFVCRLADGRIITRKSSK